MGNEAAKRAAPQPERNVQRVSDGLRAKFHRGSAYNMKIVVRGVRGVGKSALLLRLQGGEPPRAYAPTPEIKTAHIAWSSRASSDAVKVEVWDVVDHALREEKRSRRGPSTDDEDDRPAGLPSSPQHNTWQKTLSTQGSVTIGRLDAQIVDVYKGAQSVVLVFDATKRETFDYVVDEIPNVPEHLPILVLSNFSDKAEERVVSRKQLRALVRDANAAAPTFVASGAAPGYTARVHGIECSLLDNYGMKELYDYINIPFLAMKVHTLEQQLAAVRDDFATASKAFSATEERQDYAKYTQWLMDLQAKASGAGAAPLAVSPRARASSSGKKSKKHKKEKKPKKGKRGSVDEAPSGSAGAGAAAASAASAAAAPVTDLSDAAAGIAGGIDDSFFGDSDDDPINMTPQEAEAMARERAAEKERERIAALIRPDAVPDDEDAPRTPVRKVSSGGAWRSEVGGGDVADSDSDAGSSSDDDSDAELRAPPAAAAAAPAADSAGEAPRGDEPAVAADPAPAAPPAPPAAPEADVNAFVPDQGGLDASFLDDNDDDDDDGGGGGDGGVDATDGAGPGDKPAGAEEGGLDEDAPAAVLGDGAGAGAARGFLDSDSDADEEPLAIRRAREAAASGVAALSLDDDSEGGDAAADAAPPAASSGASGGAGAMSAAAQAAIAAALAAQQAAEAEAGARSSDGGEKKKRGKKEKKEKKEKKSKKAKKGKKAKRELSDSGEDL